MKATLQKMTILVPVLLLFACGKKAEPAVSDSKQPVVVKTQTVAATPQSESFTVSGTLEAREQATIGFLVAGKVQQVFADEGDYVQQGQALAALDADDYANALRIAEATLSRVQDDYVRSSELYLRNSLSQSDFVKVSTGLKEAEANYNISRKQLADTRLYAPVSGLVSVKNISAGEIVSAGMPSFTIVSTNPIRARIAVPEAEIGSVTHGMKTKVSIPALGDTLVEGSVTLIGAVADPHTRTYAVEVSLDNSQHIMKPGMVADARIITSRITQSIALPGQAIVRNSDGVPMVFVVDANSGTALQRRVTLGELTSSGVEISAGLNAGEKVVIGGQHKLKDGDAVVDADESSAVPTAAVTPRSAPADTVAHAFVPIFNSGNADSPYVRWILPALMLSLASVFLIFVIYFKHIKLALVMLAVLCYTFMAETKVKKFSMK